VLKADLNWKENNDYNIQNFTKMVILVFENLRKKIKFDELFYASITVIL